MNSLSLFLDNMHIGRGMMNFHGMNNSHLVTFLVMSLLIFTKLFTWSERRRSQARPILERSEGSGLNLARGKRSPQA
jgi:hypothetical protein